MTRLSTTDTHTAIPSERPASPHSSHHRTIIPINSSDAPSRSSSGTRHEKRGIAPQITLESLGSFLSQIDRIKGLSAHDASFSALNANFQLFHMNAEHSSDDAACHAANDSKRQKRHKSNHANRITFAAKMRFPKASFENVVYRITDLERRKEWDSNYADGRVVVSFGRDMFGEDKSLVDRAQGTGSNRTKTQDASRGQRESGEKECIQSSGRQQQNKREQSSTAATSEDHTFNTSAGVTVEKHDSSSSSDNNNQQQSSASPFADGSHDLIYIHMKSPTKLVKDRDTLLYRYTAQAPDKKRLVSIMQTYDDTANAMHVKNLPKRNSKVVRAMTHLHGYHVEDKGDYIEVIMLSDHEVGHVPQFLVKMMFDKKSLEWYKAFAGALNVGKALQSKL